MHQVHLIVLGRVQGVFYRASCQEVAQRLGLTGWVKNLPDGSVEVLAQGEKEKIEKLIEWCKKGPPGAKVSGLKIDWQIIVQQISSFNIES
jgi:acylphosphatase